MYNHIASVVIRRRILKNRYLTQLLLSLSIPLHAVDIVATLQLLFTLCPKTDLGGRAMLRGRHSGGPHVLEAVEVERCHFFALSPA